MLPLINRKCLIFLTLTCCAMSSYADSSAIYFAKQAGVIAGAAQACGQPVSTLTMRVGEVIDAIKIDATDKTYALAAFSQAEQAGSNNILQSQQLSCSQVISDYNSLPLMQPDYQEKVIKPLVASLPVPTSSTAANVAPAAPVTTATQTQTQTATTNAVPNTAPNAAQPAAPSLPNVMPSTQVPTQNYVAGNNANAMPPINPAYGGNPPNQNAGAVSQQALEMQRLQLAQQFAQIAQTLATGTQQQVNVGAGQANANNPLYNSQLNQQLNGLGSNNPIFTGEPLPQPTSK